MHRLHKQFLRNRQGAVSVITALSLVMFIGFTAAAVDFGNVFLKSRQLQGMADLAAMAAAGNLSQAQAAAQETAAANNWANPITTTVVTGTYQPLASTPAAQRFVAGGSPANAVQVTLTSSAQLYFAGLLTGSSSVALSRTATAAQAQLASFSIGSTLVSLQGGVANALLSGLTGSQVDLSAVDYNSLASAQVDLFQYSAALKSRAGITAASYNDTLATSVSTGSALQAIGDVLSAQGNSSAAGAVNEIASAVDHQSITVGQLFDLGPYGSQDYVQASGPSGFSVNALQLGSAILELAQGGHQVQFNMASTVPGISSITAYLAIGERPANSPWLTITDANTAIVSTAQARLYVDAQIVPASTLAGVASINLPIYVELASAQAKLSSLTCGASSSDEEMSLSVSPSIGSAAIGSINTAQLDDFNAEPTVGNASLIGTALLQVTGSAKVDIGGDDWQTVSFDSSQIQSNAIQTVSTNNAIAAATTSLVGNLSLNVQALGLNLGLGQSAVTASLQSTLAAVAAPLDSTLDSLEGLLGVGLGQADVWVDGVRCQDVALVQ
jgi:uncharacterized membrane protein